MGDQPNRRRKAKARSNPDEPGSSFEVWLFRYYAWRWLYLGPRGDDGYFKHQERPRVPLVGRQEEMPWI